MTLPLGYHPDLLYALAQALERPYQAVTIEIVKLSGINHQC